MAKKQMTLVELFAGLGSQNRAFSKVAKKKDIKVKVVKISEWNIHAIYAYALIHNISFKQKAKSNKMKKPELVKYLMEINISNDGVNPISEVFLKSFDIKVLRELYEIIIKTSNMSDIKKIKGEDIPNNLDVLTYSFPCQDLSPGGFIHGFTKGIDKQANTRSGLLWEVERILNERIEQKLDLPKTLLLENVQSLNSRLHREHFDEWKDFLKSIGYHNKVYKLDATNFGIPQKRVRLLMISTLVKNEDEIGKLNDFYNDNDLESFVAAPSKNSLKNFLKLEKEGVYFEEAKSSQPNDTDSRRVIWEQNKVLFTEDGNFSDYVHTITTKQDRHPNSGNIYFDYEGNIKSKFRYLTPRENFLLMGYTESDFEKIIDNNFKIRKNSYFFNQSVLYKLTGNSIVVNVLIKVFEQIIEINEMLNRSTSE